MENEAFVPICIVDVLHIGAKLLSGSASESADWRWLCERSNVNGISTAVCYLDAVSNSADVKGFFLLSVFHHF